MKILFFGDLVGRIGLDAVAAILPKLLSATKADFVICNGENLSRGRGITEKDYHDLLSIGVDCITLGNHYRDKKELDDWIDDATHLIRPANVLEYNPGVGTAIYDVDGIEVQVTNILGKAFMKEEVGEPYLALKEILSKPTGIIHIVDYHAESTSEKQIYAYAFDGLISAFLGTHTHVQTNDAHIMPKGTAYQSDVGFCGANESVIGFERENSVDKMLFGKKAPLFIDENSRPEVNGSLLDINEETGIARSITPFKFIAGKEVTYESLHL